MSEQINWNRPLAGGAKNLLDDIRALNEKIPAEMERGVQNGYLESERIAGLAERLGVQPPRIKTRRYVYLEVRQIHSYAVQAYDDADALRQAREAFGADIRSNSVPYGLRRSHWEGSERSTIISEPTTTRPALDHNLRFHTRNGRDPVALRSEPATTPVTADADSQETGTAIHEMAEVFRPGMSPADYFRELEARAASNGMTLATGTEPLSLG